METVSRRALQVLGVLALAGGAGAESYEGVSWRVPVGVTPTSSYVHSCPGRCVTYTIDRQTYAFLYVHEPLPSDSSAALKAIQAYLKEDSPDAEYVVKSNQQSVAGEAQIRLVLLDRRSRLAEYHLLLFVTQGGVTVTGELMVGSDEALDETKTLLADLMSSLQLNAPQAKAAAAAREKTFMQAAQAINNGYARGERVRLFETSELVSQTQLGVGPMLTTSEVRVRTVAFLPGGIYLNTSAPSYLTPNLKTLWEGELPARWKATPSGMEITYPNGKQELLSYGPKSGTQWTLKVGKETYWEVPPLTADDLAGIFSRDRASVSTGGTVAGTTRTAQQIRLKMGSTAELGEQAVSLFTAANASSGVQGQGAGVARWSYHPASYTLTLTLDNGRTLSGPTYASSVAFTAAQRQKKNTLWTLLGVQDWWWNP